MSKHPRTETAADTADPRAERIAHLKAQLLMEVLRGRGVTWQESLRAAREGRAGALLRSRRGG
ncbi:MAG: hypothetical protein ACOCYW_02340 [Roseicyclus sp.]